MKFTKYISQGSEVELPAFFKHNDSYVAVVDEETMYVVDVDPEWCGIHKTSPKSSTDISFGELITHNDFNEAVTTIKDNFKDIVKEMKLTIYASLTRT